MAEVTTSLKDLQQQIRLAIHNKALVCYYRLSSQCFDWMQAEDRHMVRAELKMIRAQLKKGIITSVDVGEDVFIDSGHVFDGNGGATRFDGVTLHTMEVKFRHTPCPAHMLIRKMGQMADLDVTPYYFREKRARDNAVQFVNKLEEVD